MKRPDAASLRLSNANHGSGSYTVTLGRPWRWRGGVIVDQTVDQITPVAGIIIKQ